MPSARNLTREAAAQRRGRALTMLAVVQKIVQCAVVLYLVTHGLPVVSAAELRGLASAVLAQFRITI
jgi:hypothetical protein